MDKPAGPTEGINEIRTRVAWLYHMEGMTQEQISQTLGLSRSRVLRLLASSLQDGAVQIRVTTELSHCIALERLLERAYGLERAIVVPKTQIAEEIYDRIGGALGDHVSHTLADGMTIGLGWGRTLSASLTRLAESESKGLSVVSMMGGLTRVSGVNPSEFAWRLATRLSAECYILAAPVFAPDIRTHDALMTHPGIKEIFTRAATLDLAIVSAGDLSPFSTLTRYMMLDRDDLASLQAAGSVGHVLCRFIDARGNVVDHPLNRRVLAVDPRDLTTAKQRVLASGGWEKYAVIRAAMALLKPHVLITDELIAERLAAEAQQ